MRLNLLLAAAALAFAATIGHAQEGSMVATLLPPPDLATSPASPPSRQPDTLSVPVLKQPVQKGQTITAENLTTKAIPASQVYASTITTADDLTGQQAIRPLAANQPVNRLQVKVASLVSRNQAVTIVYRRGGIELSGRGQALEDGQAGQSVRVVNPDTRSTLVGTVATNGTVEIN